MAKKRRLKGRQGARKRPSHGKLDNISSDQDDSLHSERLPSDETLSEPGTSDAPTVLTSIMDTDENRTSGDDVLGQEEMEDDDRAEVETLSIYPIRNYSRNTNSPRDLSVTEEYQMAGSDM